MGKIAVIGGSGFVGSRLIQELGTQQCYNIDKRQSPFFSEITTLKDICNKGLETVLNKDTSKVVLLAAEHRDDVSPTSLYYDVNVEGTKKVLAAMDHLNINHIVFTSSVAIYGLNKDNPNENHQPDPFNHYGKSKWLAEDILRNWYYQGQGRRTLTIIRPTVIFGERNRGNVYNLLQQITKNNFMFIGKGENKKSMAYVGNVTSFIQYCLSFQKPGYQVFNYVDKPDLNMTELVHLVKTKLGKAKYSPRIPFLIGMMGGYFFDLLAWISGKDLPISSVRVRKFCATTQFNATLAHNSEYIPPYTLSDGLERTLNYEFISQKQDSITFKTE